MASRERRRSLARKWGSFNGIVFGANDAHDFFGTVIAVRAFRMGKGGGRQFSFTADARFEFGH